MTVVSTILDSIEKNPLVELRRVIPSQPARVLVKLDSQNRTGSMKDCMALAVIQGAVLRGQLARGGTVVKYRGGDTADPLYLQDMHRKNNNYHEIKMKKASSLTAAFLWISCLHAQVIYQTNGFLLEINAKAEVVKLVDRQNKVNYVPADHPGYLVRVKTTGKRKAYSCQNAG